MHDRTELICLSVNLSDRECSISPKSRVLQSLPTMAEFLSLDTVDTAAFLSERAAENNARDGAPRYFATCANTTLGRSDRQLTSEQVLLRSLLRLLLSLAEAMVVKLC